MDAFRGIGLVLRTPRLFVLSLWPALGSLVAFFVLGYFAQAGVVRLVETYLRDSGQWAGLISVAAVLVWIFLFPFLFTALASVFFPVIFERLSLATEQAVAPGEAIPDRKLSFGEGLSETFGRILFNLSLTVAALILSLVIPLGPVWWTVATMLIALLDFTAPAFQRRGYGLGGQFKTLFPPKGPAFGFALTAALLALIPVVGVLCLPGIVVGGTLLTRKMVGQPEQQP